MASTSMRGVLLGGGYAVPCVPSVGVVPGMVLHR
jgi:hypothetical protein